MQTIANEESVEQPPRYRPSSLAIRRRRVGDRTENWRLTLRVFLPFVAAYYLSFLFRTINATVGGSLTSEFGLSAGDLGLLTSVYYLTFAAAQIPIGILLDRYGPGRIQSAVMIAAALGAALFAVSDNFWLLLCGRALIGLGVAASLTAGLKALVLWFPSERVPLLNGLTIMLGGLGAVTATLPAEFLLASVGWRALFELLAIVSAGCALVIYLAVPEVPDANSSVAGGPSHDGLKIVYADPRLWRLAPLSATCIGTAWALQGLWAAPWLSDVEGLDRSGLLWHLLIMAIALSLGGLLWGITVDRARRRGIGPRPLLGLVATMFIAAQLALILRWPLPSYVPWIILAAVGAGTVLSYAILAEYFPKELAGRANAALNVFHISGAFVVQYMTGLVVQLWIPVEGHYPEVAYQTAFAFNVGLQIVAGIWFAAPICSLVCPKMRATCRTACLRITESLDIPCHVRNQNTVGSDRVRFIRRAHDDVGRDAIGGVASRLSAAARAPLV
jgi:MFS family permease